MNDMIGVNPKRNFQYLGCSGAKAPDIMKYQVPKMKQAQLVTLSAGGNDAHLASILNWCVYQWFTSRFFFWTSCDAELKGGNDAVDSSQYTTDLKNLMAAIRPKLSGATSRIYWVGYEKFWDTTTKDCDSVSWSFYKISWSAAYLTQARRYPSTQ